MLPALSFTLYDCNRRVMQLFDRYDWDGEPEPSETQNALQVPNDVLPSQDNQPEELDEVEKRLERAHYYRMLLRHQLISSESEEAIEVENEIQDFVRERL